MKNRSLMRIKFDVFHVILRTDYVFIKFDKSTLFGKSNILPAYFFFLLNTDLFAKEVLVKYID